jgi:GNAT superfamily N-acetyltransferase
MAFSVREASAQDLPALKLVELRAAERFNAETVVAGLAKRTVPIKQLESAQVAGTLWVAATEDEVIVGFLLAEHLDNQLHIEEMSVVPSHGRQGIGAALLEAVKRYAKQTGRRVTLTTFDFVPWNGPFYAKRGFRVMTGTEVGVGLAARVRKESELGLVNRVVMCSSDA